MFRRLSVFTLLALPTAAWAHVKWFEAYEVSAVTRTQCSRLDYDGRPVSVSKLNGIRSAAKVDGVVALAHVQLGHGGLWFAAGAAGLCSYVAAKSE